MNKQSKQCELWNNQMKNLVKPALILSFIIVYHIFLMYVTCLATNYFIAQPSITDLKMA